MIQKKVLMLNQKGGSGKTIIADQLCYMADRSGVPYSLLDDDQQGGLGHEAGQNRNAVVTFIDTPGQVTEDLVQLIPEADLIIVPTMMSMQDMEPLENTIEVLMPFIARGKDVLFVLNGWNRFSMCADFEEWFHRKYPMLEYMKLSQSEVLKQAEARGESVLDYRKWSTSGREMLALWNAVMETHLGFEFTEG